MSRFWKYIYDTVLEMNKLNVGSSYYTLVNSATTSWVVRATLRRVIHA
jgi:hypothetical protein